MFVPILLNQDSEIPIHILQNQVGTVGSTQLWMEILG